MNTGKAGQYETRGNLQIVRHATLQEFTCSRCGNQKKSKLVAHRVSEPSKILCNGCCGLLLSKTT